MFLHLQGSIKKHQIHLVMSDQMQVTSDQQPENLSISGSHYSPQLDECEEDYSVKPQLRQKQRGVCSFYLRSGWCKFGHKCRFQHPRKVGQPKNVCRVFEVSGQCRYGANCRFLHELLVGREEHDEKVVSDKPSHFISEDGSQDVEKPRKVIQRKVCRFLKEGGCTKGNSCRYYHPKESLDVRVENTNNTTNQSQTSDITAVKAPPQMQNVFKVDDLDDDDLIRLRDIDINQMMKRFSEEEVLVMENEGKPSVYRVTVHPTDPDWPFDIRDFELNVTFPEDYPLVPLEAVLPEDQDLPEVVVKHISTCSQEWITAKHETNLLMGKVELMFRPFLRWFDRSLEKLFTEGARSYKKEVDAKAAGFEFVSNRSEETEAVNLFERVRIVEKPKDIRIITQQIDGVLQKSNKYVESDGEDDDEEEYSSTESSSYDEEETESEEEEHIHPKPAIQFDSPSDNPRGTEVLLRGLQLGKSVATVAISKLAITLNCERCKNRCNIVTPPRRKNLIPCVKCRESQYLIYRPCLVHQHSSVMGFLDLDGCIPFDVNLTECILQVGCMNCSKDFELKGLQNGQTQSVWCDNCHKKLELKIDTSSFQRLQPADRMLNLPLHIIKLKGQKRRKDPAIVEGHPLPDNGSCKHYKKSFRWLRFPCCGQFYPCDECHDEQEDHEMIFASRMLCGFCCKEQPFSPDKPCISCNSLTTKGRTTHWEGGQGCRNKTKMSRNDKQKYVGGNKTTSKKSKHKEELKMGKKKKQQAKS